MKDLNRKNAGIGKPFREQVLQFGGGNFMRAFVDWILDVYNDQKKTELGILVVASTGSNRYQPWQDQEGLYHVLTKGFKNGECNKHKSFKYPALREGQTQASGTAVVGSGA